MPLFQIIGAVLGAGIIVTLASIMWPSFTDQPRPEALTRFHDILMQSEAGRNTALVLGVSDETSEPVNVGATVSAGANTVVENVTKSVQHIVRIKLLESLAKQFHELPEDEQTAFRERICTPVIEPDVPTEAVPTE